MYIKTICKTSTINIKIFMVVFIIYRRIAFCYEKNNNYIYFTIIYMFTVIQ